MPGNLKSCLRSVRRPILNFHHFLGMDRTLEEVISGDFMRLIRVRSQVHMFICRQDYISESGLGSRGGYGVMALLTYLFPIIREKRRTVDFPPDVILCVWEREPHGCEFATPSAGMAQYMHRHP